MMSVTVFQVKASQTREFGFMGLKEREAVLKLDSSNWDIVDMSVYDVVYGEREIAGWALFDFPKTDKDALETLFRLTNVPSKSEAEILKKDGWCGRSMSVSDIVQINDRFYYCDSVGFQEIKPKNVPNWIYVGMGATGCHYSDLYPYEVTRISKSGKVVYIRVMDAKRVGKNHNIGDQQEYTYTSRTDMEEETVRKTKKGWRTPGGMSVAFGFMRKYEDPSF